MLLCVVIIPIVLLNDQFFILKRINNYLRGSMEEKKLNSLSLLAIESELVHNIDFENIVNNFSSQKSCKKLTVYYYFYFKIFYSYFFCIFLVLI